MAIPVRGVNNLKTMSGRVNQLSQPYRAYMQITCLEMEKARRESERRAASTRVGQIDARLKQIEIEKAKLLEAINQPTPERRGPLSRMKLPAPGKNYAGFKLRY